MEDEKKKTEQEQAQADVAKDAAAQETTATNTESAADAEAEPAPEEAAPAEEPETSDSAKETRAEKRKKKKEKKEEIAHLQEELSAENERYLRLLAEYQNYRNRTTEEKKKIYGDAKVDVCRALLDVMDSFERALEAPCGDEAYKKGVEMTFAQIQKAFASLGITEIPALGQPFDPKVHQSIKQVDDSDMESDMVCEVFQKGYALGDRLIRPALVAVSV